MQESLNRFAKACDNFGLTISIKKTELMYQPAPKTPYTEPVITVNCEKLTVAKKSIYLGSFLSHSVSIDKEVFYRIARASLAFGTLRKKVWEKRGINLLTKLKVYRAIILPTLLYACETWLYIVVTPDSRTLSTCDAFGNCFASVGRIKCPTQKYSKKLT